MLDRGSRIHNTGCMIIACPGLHTPLQNTYSLGAMTTLGVELHSLTCNESGRGVGRVVVSEWERSICSYYLPQSAVRDKCRQKAEQVGHSI